MKDEQEKLISHVKEQYNDELVEVESKHSHAIEGKCCFPYITSPKFDLLQVQVKSLKIGSQLSQSFH